MDPTGYINGFAVECDRKKGIKDNAKVVIYATGNMHSPLNDLRKNVREVDLWVI